MKACTVASQGTAIVHHGGRNGTTWREYLTDYERSHIRNTTLAQQRIEWTMWILKRADHSLPVFWREQAKFRWNVIDIVL